MACFMIIVVFNSIVITQSTVTHVLYIVRVSVMEADSCAVSD